MDRDDLHHEGDDQGGAAYAVAGITRAGGPFPHPG